MSEKISPKHKEGRSKKALTVFLVFTLVVLAFVPVTLYFFMTSVPSEDEVQKNSSAAQPFSTELRQTEVIEFDPDSIELPYTNPVPATCSASTVVLSPDVYKCATEVGSILDPCFVADENKKILACSPSPVLGSYQALVTATNSLAARGATNQTPSTFYIQLFPQVGPGLTCSKNPLPYKNEIDNNFVTYNCNAPGSFILEDLNTKNKLWTSNHVIQNSDSPYEVTYQDDSFPVQKAWTY